MIGRTPGNIVAIRPLKDGVIADFDIAQTMLKKLIEKVTSKSAFHKPKNNSMLSIRGYRS